MKFTGEEGIDIIIAYIINSVRGFPERCRRDGEGGGGGTGEERG